MRIAFFRAGVGTGDYEYDPDLPGRVVLADERVVEVRGTRSPKNMELFRMLRNCGFF